MGISRGIEIKTHSRAGIIHPSSWFTWGVVAGVSGSITVVNVPPVSVNPKLLPVPFTQKPTVFPTLLIPTT
jgi:hypothetical protein